MSYMAGVAIGNRYRVLSQLGSGGMGIVYQAFDRLTRQTVALKSMISPLNDDATPVNPRATAIRVALTNEFQILASLQHPHVIHVLDYGFDAQHNPFFTMNFLEGARSITQAGEGQTQAVKIRFITEMLQALAYLHQHDIIHHDLKPDNALVTAEGEVKVLDFGLAVLRNQRKPQNEVSGTLPYIAPETFLGAPVDAIADLYTVGIIAYEILAEVYPFELDDPGILIEDILHTAPDMDLLNVENRLRNVIARLLEKSPTDRYANAYETLRALSEATATPIQIETPAIRESFLQAARFVGREQELSLLTTALKDILEGKGSTWLISGESGVGKSRLLQELRVHALVEGVLVLQGQEVEGIGFPYHLWREPLRHLILERELSDIDASVLQQIIPDIGDLLNRMITPAPELDGQQGQQRLVDTIISLFIKQNQPILLILEDLEWAEDSLDVLKQLMPVIPTLPLLVVGSYRHEEHPSLPDELVGSKVIRLEKFSEKGIAELSTSMLGDISKRPEVLELLKHETEGNAFFLVEVVRALSEIAGSLSAISSMEMPKQVLANGVQQVVQNRLKHLPDDARPILNLAAIVGREIDLDLLRAIDSTTNFEQWLTVCSNAAILDVQDQHWRFAHDRFRESILNSLTEDKSKLLHQEVAVVLERVYAASLEEYSSKIADHYEAAGKLDVALPWCVRAAKYADAAYAPTVAIVYYRKALMMWKYGGEQGTAGVQLVYIYEHLGELLNWVARYEEAIQVFKEMLHIGEASQDKDVQAAAWHGIARAQTYQGSMRDALESASHAETLAREGNSSGHAAQTMWKGWIQFRLGNLQAAQELAEQVLQLSKDEVTSLLGNTHNLLGVIQISSGEYAKAALSFEKALEIFQTLSDQLRAMTIVNNLGWLAEVRGDYELAASRYQEALTLARRYGHRNAEIVYLSNYGGVRVMRGDYVAAEANLRQVIKMAGEKELGILSETYNYLAQACLHQGNISDALSAAQHALHLGYRVNSQDYIAAAWRVLGLVAAESLIQINITINESSPALRYDAKACLSESLRVGKEGSVKSEEAKTLRAWAQHEFNQGNEVEAQAMWHEAHSIFEQLGADLEAQRMNDFPLIR
jgi:serine/threonine protein kinase/tetratricopeptide (TPR) repeat protein